MKFICFPALVAGSMVFAGSLAHAQTATGSLGVTAEVTRTCTLSASTIAFGELSAAAVNKADTVVTVVCNGASSVSSLTVGMGENAASGAQRVMTNADADSMPYTLHVAEGDDTDIAADGAITVVDDSAESNTFGATIYGEIEASTDYQMGSYSDTVVLTAVYGP